MALIGSPTPLVTVVVCRAVAGEMVGPRRRRWVHVESGTVVTAGLYVAREDQPSSLPFFSFFPLPYSLPVLFTTRLIADTAKRQESMLCTTCVHPHEPNREQIRGVFSPSRPGVVPPPLREPWRVPIKDVAKRACSSWRELSVEGNLLRV